MDGEIDGRNHFAIARGEFELWSASSVPSSWLNHTP
jgi:hypothetical protein